MPGPAIPRVATCQMAVRRARMSIIFTVVGLVWLVASLAYSGRLTPRTLTSCSMVGATALIVSLALLRRAPRLPREPMTREQQARIRRIVIAINILEWVAVATACAVLMLVHLPEYIPTAAGIIVGLYLYPIAGALRAPLHTATATLLLGWNCVALATLSRWRQVSVGAAGTGGILLASSAVTLAWALWRTRNAAPLPTVAAADMLAP
ncbi:hypothetical protein [Terriglobus aquaticus]|uniref:Uncharacterized protein n=1 Tax=Terriglobus aquaticus TaxID=940139 RepID=A0ABW9KHN5_9BACT|nr:hypothetical protein [Terriglobus aquaticus]